MTTSSRDLQARAPRTDAMRRAFAAVTKGWLPGALVACSGGHDSTALLLIASRACDVGKLAPFAVAHVDHGARPDSGADAEFVAALCRQLAAPFVRVTLCLGEQRHDEASLRAARYAALARTASSLGATGVVTAHTRDDQVETVLMRLLSGSGALAAAGMQPRSMLDTASGPLVVARPLLGVARAQLTDVLRNAGVVPRRDPSNDDVTYRRNALRSLVIPPLAASWPGFERGLLRAVELAARDAQVVDQLGIDAATRVVIDDGVDARVEREWVRAAPLAVATRVLRAAAEWVVPASARRELTLERLEALCRAADGRTGSRIELPGGATAEVRRETIVFVPPPSEVL